MASWEANSVESGRRGSLFKSLSEQNEQLKLLSWRFLGGGGGGEGGGGLYWAY